MFARIGRFLGLNFRALRAVIKINGEVYLIAALYGKYILKVEEIINCQKRHKFIVEKR